MSVRGGKACRSVISGRQARRGIAGDTPNHGQPPHRPWCAIPFWRGLRTEGSNRTKGGRCPGLFRTCANNRDPGVPLGRTKSPTPSVPRSPASDPVPPIGHTHTPSFHSGKTPIRSEVPLHHQPPYPTNRPTPSATRTSARVPALNGKASSSMPSLKMTPSSAMRDSNIRGVRASTRPQTSSVCPAAPA